MSVLNTDLSNYLAKKAEKKMKKMIMRRGTEEQKKRLRDLELERDVIAHLADTLPPMKME